MYTRHKVVVVMPAYNAARTLRRTYDEVMAQGVVDHVIVVDDASRDRTVDVARELPGVQVAAHDRNRGYGGNQKTCYQLALDAGADIVIMVHPDYQYTPRLIPAMASLIGSGLYPCVLGSRILGGHAMRSGMPVWKYAANRLFRRSLLHQLPPQPVLRLRLPRYSADLPARALGTAAVGTVCGLTPAPDSSGCNPSPANIIRENPRDP